MVKRNKILLTNLFSLSFLEDKQNDLNFSSINFGSLTPSTVSENFSNVATHTKTEKNVDNTVMKMCIHKS